MRRTHVNAGAFLAAAYALLIGAAGAVPRKARLAKPAAPPAAAPAVAPAPPSARDAMRELEALIEEERPFLARLVALQKSYETTDDLESIRRERTELRSAFMERRRRFGPLFATFNERRKSGYLVQFRRLMSDRDSVDLDSTMADGAELEDFYKTARVAGFEAESVLAGDEGAWKAAERRLAARKKNRLAAAGAAGALALLAAAGFYAYRRQPRFITAHLTAEPAPITGPVLSGPSGPQMLSGPAALLSAPAGRPAVSGPAAPALLSGPGGAPAAAALAPGAVLGGNYRVGRELGRGGMGVVVEALDLTLQRKVAVKLMLAEVGQEPGDLDRFLTEARLVAALKHPNIVEIHTLFREGPSLCLVFECVPGYPLSAYLGRGKNLSARSTSSVARQVASALDYAHAQKVIHRDLKPANIMVTPQGLAKVMDFGLAHQAKQTLARVTRTDSWGTMPYMAPEQEVGEVSRESDLFAFGVCLYEMLTGRLPFAGPNFLAQKREQRFSPPSAAGLPGGVDAVFARALAPAAKDRFHSGAELAAALDAVLAGAA